MKLEEIWEILEIPVIIVLYLCFHQHGLISIHKKLWDLSHTLLSLFFFFIETVPRDIQVCSLINQGYNSHLLITNPEEFPLCHTVCLTDIMQGTNPDSSVVRGISSGI